MKTKQLFSALLLAVVFAVAGFNAKAAGPVKFGIKAGLTVNELKFNTGVFDTDNRSGFTAGLMTKFTAPIIGIGFDASVMYTRRSYNIYATDQPSGLPYNDKYNNNYIEIPINFRWDIGLPVVGKFVTPFLTTGPDFSFLLNKSNAEAAWKDHTFDFAWNFGVGVMFVNKVQIHASYGLGLNNAASGNINSLYGNADGKNRFWTVTAAYLF